MTDQAVLQDARRYLAMLHKRRGIVVTCFLVSLSVAVLYNYTTRPVYQATTQILIDRDTPDVLPNKELVDLVQGGTDYYQTQYQLLRSRTLAERAVERLNLQTHPELATGPMTNPWERLRGFLGYPSSAVVDTTGLPLPPAAAAFRSRIQVEPVAGSRLVNLHFRAYHPQMAADAVNTLAQLYMEQALELRFTTSTEATGWLTDRVKEQHGKLLAAEQALQQYREREGLVDQESRGGLVDQKLGTLNGAVLEARTERIAKETLYNQISSLGPGQLDSFPLVLGSGAVLALKTELSALQKEEALLAESLGDRHPEMVRVRGQIRTTQDKIRGEIRNVARAAESEYRTALAREARLQASLDSVKNEAQAANRQSIEYVALQREVETNRQLYQDLLTKTKQTGLETELKTTNIRVIEKAETPRRPVSPKKARSYQVAVILGLLVGIGLALGFEHMDNTFKTPEDVREQLQLPFLGMVPDVGLKPTGGGRIPQLVKSPNSAVADAYRVLRTNLIFSSAPDTPGRVILVSSANPAEGKTTTLANLAVALAQNGAKVLAVDADLRRPTLYQHFGVTEDPRPHGPDRGQVGGVAGDPLDQGRGIAAAAVRVPDAQPGGASGLADDEADHRRAARPLRVGADRRAAASGDGGRARALPARGRCRAGDRGRVGLEAGGDACGGPGAERRRQDRGAGAEQGQSRAQLVLLQPVLR